LNGLDWVMVSLDREMRRTTGAGNNSQVVLNVGGALNSADVSNRFFGFASGFPHLNARIRRDRVNLAPYWEFAASRADGPTAFMEVIDPPDENGTSVLEDFVNRPLPERPPSLRAVVIAAATGSAFALSFDHRVLDALGAERFLDAFERGGMKNDLPVDPMDFLQPNTAGLTRWADKFRGGRDVNRMFLRMSRIPSRRLPLASSASPPLPFRFRHLHFGPDKTEAILERAWSKAGYLMEMPYFLAASAQALHSMFQSKGAEGSAYSIPVTTDTRPQANSRKETFFNYASFLFFQLPVEQVHNRLELVRLLKSQMYEQVEKRFPRQVAEASMLLRIAPPSVVGRIMSATLRKRASFSFSYLGRPGYTRDRFCGLPVRNLFHMPRVPYPPGVGVFFNRFAGSLNVTLSWLSGLADEGAMEDVMDRLRSTL